MPQAPPSKPSANSHASRPAGVPLEQLLGRIAAATSAQELDRALWEARSQYIGPLLDQLERAAAQRAHYLLASLDGA